MLFYIFSDVGSLLFRFGAEFFVVFEVDCRQCDAAHAHHGCLTVGKAVDERIYFSQVLRAVVRCVAERHDVVAEFCFPVVVVGIHQLVCGDEESVAFFFRNFLGVSHVGDGLFRNVGQIFDVDVGFAQFVGVCGGAVRGVVIAACEILQRGHEFGRNDFVAEVEPAVAVFVVEFFLYRRSGQSVRPVFAAVVGDTRDERVAYCGNGGCA